MAFKVTIDGGIILEKCIESVCCYVHPPSDDIFTTISKCKNTMTITGRIGTDEQTIGLYQWALIPPYNSEGYKKVIMEEINEDKLVRKVCFQKAFIVEYSETYTSHNGAGYFSIDLKEFIGSQIECSSMTDVLTSGNSSNSGPSESSQQSGPIDDSASEEKSSSQEQKPTPQSPQKSNTAHPPIFKGSGGASNVEAGTKSRFKYEHNPSNNPKALKDALEDPNAVYGYRPRSDGSLKKFANGDWSDPEYVEMARQNRIAYHKKNEAALQKLRDEGLTDTQIAKKMVDERNQNRLNSYIDANGNITDQAGYNQALEHSKTYDQLISEGKTDQDIINSSTRGNPGMDACTGLYDDYYDTYTGEK